MIGMINNLINMFKRTRIPEKEFQLQIDTMRLHLLLSYWSIPCHLKGGAAASKIIEESDALPHIVRTERLKALLNEQMKLLTVRLAQEQGISIPPGSLELVQQGERGAPERLPRPVPGASLIPGAGRGVFLRGGACEPGSITGIHPGLVFLPEHVFRMPGFPSITDPLHHICIRLDGSVLHPNMHQDSEGEIMTLDPERRFGDTSFDSGHGASNPFAIAHLVNHPPPGQEPNVLICDYDFPPSVSEALSSLIPNRVYTDPDSAMEDASPRTSHAKPTSVLVASRRIEEGEELFLDYRFNPAKKVQWPKWYVPYDDEAAARRWDGIETIG